MNSRRMLPALLFWRLLVFRATLIAQTRGLKKVQVGVPAISMGNIIIYLHQRSEDLREAWSRCRAGGDGRLRHRFEGADLRQRANLADRHADGDELPCSRVPTW